MACCVCGLRQAWGKPGSTGDIIGRKTTRLGITPPALYPLTLHQPAVHELIALLHPFYIPSSHRSPPFFSSPSLCSYSTPLTLFNLNRTTFQQALLSQTFLNWIHFDIVTSAVYLLFIWHSLRQMVHWLRNTFMHANVNMSEVFGACWGWIQCFTISKETRCLQRRHLFIPTNMWNHPHITVYTEERSQSWIQITKNVTYPK